jgi:hypothetical protein
VGGSTTITLSDHTTSTFAGVSTLSAADFSTSPGAGAGKGDDHGHGHSGDDDLSHIRDIQIGHSDH